MSNAADVSLRAKQLEELVATAQFQYFFDRMLDFVSDFGTKEDRYETLLRCGSFSEIAKQFRQQTIVEADFKVQRNKLVLEALNQKDVLYEVVILKSPPPPMPPASPTLDGRSQGGIDA
jgi:tRNA U34 5-methylaminomethyl-2-thiouridine-forming methyltransferase MnmC